MRMRAYHTSKPQRPKTAHYFLPASSRPQRASQGPRVRAGRGQGPLLAIFDDIDQPPGQAAVEEATRRAEAFATRYEHLYPSAVACLTSTLRDLTTHLRFPREHWQRIRHTNLLERTFGETRRRTKVIGRLPGERSCLTLVWAVLDRASKGWRGLTYTPAATRLFQDLRRQLFRPPEQEVIDQAITAAA